MNCCTVVSHVIHGIPRHFCMFSSSTTWDRSTTHPKFDPTRVPTHDLQIMTVHLSHVTETPSLTTRPSCSDFCQSRYVKHYQDSTVNQLAFLYHTFCQAIDNKKEMRIVFCDVSKAFDKVWHEGLLYKLNSIGICGHLLRRFRDYLSERQQRVLVRGQSSDWGYNRSWCATRISAWSSFISHVYK